MNGNLEDLILTSVSTSTIMVLSYAVVSRATLLLATIFVASLLSPADFGLYSYIVVTASSIATLSSFGIGVTCNVTASKNYIQDPQLVTAVYSAVIIICGLLSLLISMGFAIPVNEISSKLSYWQAFMLLFLLSILMTNTAAIEGLFYGLRLNKTMIVIAIIVFISVIISTILLTSKYFLIGAIAGLVLHRVISFLCFAGALKLKTGVKVSRKMIFERDKDVKARMLEISLPIAFASTISGPVTALAIYVLEFRSGLVAVAEFTLAYQFYIVGVFVPGALSHFILSLSSSGEAEPVRVLKQSLLVSLSYGFLAIIGLGLVPILIPYVIKNIVLELPIMLYFGIAVFFYSLSVPFHSYWSATGKAKIVFWSQLSWAASMILIVYTVGRGDTSPTLIAISIAVGSGVQLVVNVCTFWYRRNS